MKQHLNTLFVTTEGAYLTKDGAAVAVRIEKKTRLRLPLHNLDGIVCFGRIGASPRLLSACAEAGVSVSFMSAYGRLQARVLGFTSGNVLLRREQYHRSESPEQSLSIARSIVIGKLANSRQVLLRSARDADDAERCSRLRAAATRLRGNLQATSTATSMSQVQGIEGEGAATYFSCFNDTLVGDGAFAFNGRSRRPPMDRVNSILSFLYSVLAHDVRSACEAVGLDSQVGFLHAIRPGRPGLALDLMEEFRSVLVDRLTMTLINRRQLSPQCFEFSPAGGVLMNDRARREVLTAWQAKKQETIHHPFTGEDVTIGLLVHLQARLLARHIRGDLDAYPPMFWK